MAEIPVERKSGGIPWWVWLLIAAIIVALLIWWASDDEPELAVDTAPVTAVDPVTPVDTGPITEMSMLMPTIPADMVGRQVQLSNVPVIGPVSDAGFWIGTGPDQRLYAVLSEVRTPNTAMEGEADVNAGQTANINGTIRTRDEVLQGLAVGTNTDSLPPGVDRFIVVSSYEPQGGS